MSHPAPQQTVSTRTRGVAGGTWLVVGLLLLGLAAASTGVWFQRHQTRRCLEFYGPAAARRISAAPVVELLIVQPGGAPGRLACRTRIDVSKAPGLVHLRRGLVEDANFTWQATATSASPEARRPSEARLPAEVWDAALVFSEPATSDAAGNAERSGGGQTTLVIDIDPAGGAIAMLGQPGRMRLGRIGPGLEKWIRSTLSAAR
jgi:hypothetical protein